MHWNAKLLIAFAKKAPEYPNNYLVKTLVRRQSSLVLDDLVDGAADAPPAPAAVPQGEDGGWRTQPTTLQL